MEVFLSILSNLLLFVAIICGLAGCVGFVWRIGVTEDTHDSPGVFVTINLLLFAGLTICAAIVLLLLFTSLHDHLNQTITDFSLKIGSVCAVINGMICGLLGIGGLIGRIAQGENPDKDALSYRITMRLFVGGLAVFGVSSAALILPQLNGSLSKNVVNAWFPIYSHEVPFIGMLCGLFGIIGYGRSIIGDLDVDTQAYRNIHVLPFVYADVQFPERRCKSGRTPGSGFCVDGRGMHLRLSDVCRVVLENSGWRLLRTPVAVQENARLFTRRVACFSVFDSDCRGYAGEGLSAWREERC